MDGLPVQEIIKFRMGGVPTTEAMEREQTLETFGDELSNLRKNRSINVPK